MSRAREFDLTFSSKLYISDICTVVFSFSMFWFTCRSYWLLTFFLRFSVVSTIFIMEFIHPSWRVRLLLSSCGNLNMGKHTHTQLHTFGHHVALTSAVYEVNICINYRTSGDNSPWRWKEKSESSPNASGGLYGSSCPTDFKLTRILPKSFRFVYGSPNEIPIPLIFTSTECWARIQVEREEWKLTKCHKWS